MTRRFGLLVPVLLIAPLGPTTAAYAQPCRGWVEPRLSGRNAHAMAYDSARGVTVLFGGGDALHDTWEWDGTTWTQRATTGPAGRIWHAMAYDSARRATILFGGFDWNLGGTSIYYGDTWEWDGATWTLRSEDGPVARCNHALCYDSRRGVTVLAAGRYGFDLADTWEWDGASWVQRADGVPLERREHAMVYDSVRRTAVLFGGSTDVGGHYADPLGETWEWDGGGAAAWINYGTGWPGTSGVPSLTVSSAPVLCAPIAVDLANSLGASTLAALFVGLAPADQPTGEDGHLLLIPSNFHLFTLPAAGISIPASVPCNPVLCGRSIYLQALEADPAATQGVSFTRGARLVIGS